MSDSRNILIYYLRILKKIRALLLSKISRNFLIFLSFVLIALFFWLLQTLNDTYETEVLVPVKLVNVPSNVIITSDPPSSIKVNLRDKGTVLMNYVLGNKFQPIIINYDDYRNNGYKITIPTTSFNKKITGQLAQSTRLLSMKPDYIEYIYALGEKKKVPVVINGEMEAAKKYYISEKRCIPDSVIVYAPSVILDTIKVAYTKWFTVKNISDTVNLDLDLKKIEGVKFKPSKVKVMLGVDVYAQKTIEVPIRGINFPYGKILRTFPSKVKVTFLVGMNNFKSVGQDDFFIGITYDDIIHNNSDKYQITLKSYPGYVNHIKLDPSEVDYLIEEQAANND